MLHPTALSCILLYPPAPLCALLPWDLTFPASTSSPVSASYSGMAALQGKGGC